MADFPPGTRTTTSPADTEGLGAALARTLAPGDVVLLVGEVGAGKTTLVRGALRALGVRGAVPSPTFTLARSYPDADPPASHLDLHRLGGTLADEDPGLLADHLAPERVAFVEWPPAAGELPAARWLVSLEHAGEDARTVTVAEPA